MIANLQNTLFNTISTADGLPARRAGGAADAGAGADHARC